MAKFIDPWQDKNRAIGELKLLGDMVHSRQLVVRHWNVSTNIGSPYETFDFELIEVRSGRGMQIGKPEHKLLDLLGGSIHELENGKSGHLSYGVTDLQHKRDMVSGRHDIYIQFAVIDMRSQSRTVSAGGGNPAPLISQQHIQAMKVMLNQSPMIDFDPKLPMELKDKGVSIEPIVAYRDFCLDPRWEEGPLLRSRNGIMWVPYERHYAICTRTNGIYGHDAPMENCECGVYAFMNPDHKDMRDSDAQVWAEIYLWGEVLVCETGYRAQYAYPKTLFLRDTGTKVIRWVAEQLQNEYGVPCLLMTGEKKRLSHLMDDALSQLLGGEGVKS